jgi:hypothetical protein
MKSTEKKEANQKSILNFLNANNTSSNNKGIKRTYTDMLEGQLDETKTATQLVKSNVNLI